MIQKEQDQSGKNKLWELVVRAANKNYISIDIILEEIGVTWKQFTIDFCKDKVDAKLQRKYTNGIASAVEKGIQRRALLLARYGINTAANKKMQKMAEYGIEVAVMLGAWDKYE